MARDPHSLIPTWTTRRVVLATLFVLFVAISFWLLYRFRMVIFILFVALVLGTAIRPFVDRLHRYGISRALGVILVYLLLLAAVGGFILLVAPLIIEQVTTISSKLPDYYDNLRQQMIDSPSRLIQRLGRELPFDLPTPIGPVPGETQRDAASLDAVAQALIYVELISRSIFIAMAILLLAFYWTLDGERIVRSLLLIVSLERRETIREIITTIEDKLGAFIRGQAILCLSVGLLALIAYLLIGLPYALVLAVIAGVLEIVPIAGPILAAVPPILLALASDPSKLIWIVLATIIIQQLENNLLVPRIMDRTVGINPIMSLLALAAFSSLLGVPGALLAIPIAVVIQLLLDRFVLNVEVQEQPEGRDRLSTMRYELQQLVGDVRKTVRHKESEPSTWSDEVEDALEVIANDLDRILAQASPQEQTEVQR